MKNLLFILSLILFSCKVTDTVVSSNDQSQMQKLIINADFTTPELNPAFTITNASISGDILTLDIQYSGGCAEHNFELYFNGRYKKSMPMQASLYLVHKNNDDSCRELIKKSIKFDIGELKTSSADQKEIIISLNGYDKTISYKFQ